MTKMGRITIKPIGFVKNSIKEPRIGGFANEFSEIIVDKKLASALDGIDRYSHIVVLFWMDKAMAYVLKHRPQNNPNVPIVGIFACRCPRRPNPIAMTAVKLVKREKNKLIVKGLDALDGTSVIDIKPYSKRYDKVSNSKEPEWIKKLRF